MLENTKIKNDPHMGVSFCENMCFSGSILEYYSSALFIGTDCTTVCTVPCTNTLVGLSTPIPQERPNTNHAHDASVVHLYIGALYVFPGERASYGSLRLLGRSL